MALLFCGSEDGGNRSLSRLVNLLTDLPPNVKLPLAQIPHASEFERDPSSGYYFTTVVLL